eukprot:GILI01021844.1.p1 GENE.GILI01021844.1~~GILI01021844.1.p1  ORF type:complete len:250 (-),score=52.45 GILI01021844.1:34-783(-)
MAATFEDPELGKSPSGSAPAGSSSFASASWMTQALPMYFQMFESTRTHATGFSKTYANIDVVRPFFDVETRDVCRRLISSLVPGRNQEMLRTPDMYGPLMLVFTLVAILNFSMKHSHHNFSEGTAMGTAMVTCLTYWGVFSMVMYTVCYFTLVPIRLVSVLCLFGYGLFSYCLCLLLNIILPSFFFYAAFITAGGASAASIALAFVAASHEHPPRALVPAAVGGGIHFLFLLYLKLSYASFYEAVSEAI